jgi:hypothetical protein
MNLKLSELSFLKEVRMAILLQLGKIYPASPRIFRDPKFRNWQNPLDYGAYCHLAFNVWSFLTHSYVFNKQSDCASNSSMQMERASLTFNDKSFISLELLELNFPSITSPPPLFVWNCASKIFIKLEQGGKAQSAVFEKKTVSCSKS